MKHWITVIAFLILVVVAVGCSAVVNSEGFKVGSPRDFAEATHIARLSYEAVEATRQAVSIEATRETSKINAQATTAAAQAKATATAAAWQAESTRTAWTLSVQATETAVPYNAPRVAAAASAEITNRRALSLALAGGIAVALLFGLAVVAWMQTLAKALYPNKAGQMPLVLQDNAVMDPNRQLGAGVITPGKPGALWTVARVVHYLRTGEVLELPQPKLELADGHPTAQQYLEAAKGASQVATAAAVFQPGDPKAREAKVELLTRQGGKGAMGFIRPGQSRVVLNDAAVGMIAAQLGDRIMPPQIEALYTTQPSSDGVEGEP